MTFRPGMIGAIWRGRLARQTLWLTAPFVVQQGLRLVTNVVLAWLLAPEMFGVMLLINTLRTGVELLSDIGIGQSVVRSSQAGDRTFLDTAWTIQVARGVLLTLVGLAAAKPLADAYGNPDLVPMIGLVSLTFLLTGLQSPNIFVMQRNMQVGQRAVYDLASAIGTSVVTILLAAAWGSIWALVWGLVLSVALSTLLTFAFPPYRLPRFAWRRDHAHDILHFGKWVFLSTAVYFAAISTDRLYFTAVLPLALVGIYGVARNFADLSVTFAQRIGSFIVFPRIVELRQAGGDITGGFRRNRRLALGIIGAGLAVALACSDQFVLVLYDARYHAAAFMLPVLLVGMWFSVLAAFGEATLFGLDRPRAAAIGNVGKCVTLIAALPLVVPTMGMFAGLLVLSLGELVRWLLLAWSLRRDGMAPLRDDLLATSAIALAAVAMKMALSAIGWVPTFSQWWALGATVR